MSPALPGAHPRWQPIGLSGGGGTEMPAISPHDPRRILLQCDMSCAFLTENGGETWTMYHWANLLGCPFCAPVFHPRDPAIVFAAYGYPSELRISRDAGRTFQPFGEGLPGGLRRLVIDAARPEVMFAATDTALFRSADGGARWQPIGTVPGAIAGLHIDQSQPAPGRCLLLATRETVYRSPDDGASWQQCGAGLPLKPILAFAGGSNRDAGLCRLYAWVDAATPAGHSSGELYRSRDRGQNWERAAARPVPDDRAGEGRYLLTTDVRPDTLYAVNPARTNGEMVLRSDDAGTTWRSVAVGNKRDPHYNMGHNHISVYFNSLAGWTFTGAGICPTNPDIVLVSDYCTPWLTRDGGCTWQNIAIHHAPGQGAPANGQRWVCNGMTNTSTWNYYIDPFERRRHYIAYTDLGMARSEDAGASWIWVRDIGPNTYEMAFDPEVPGRIWAAFSQVHDIPNNNIVLAGHSAEGYGTVGYSEDFGATWIDPTLGVPIDDERWFGAHRRANGTAVNGLPQAPVVSLVLDPRFPRDRRRLYASVWEQGVFRSDNGGRTWTAAREGLGVPGCNLRVCRLRLHPDGTLFCVVTGKKHDNWLIPEGVGLYASSDEGRSWRRLTAGLDGRWLTDFAVDPRDSRVLFLAACDDPGRDRKEGGLYVTRDGGAAWERAARHSGYHFGATIHPARPDWVYLTMTYNEGKAPPLWLSRDSGRTWTPFKDYPFCSAHRVHFDPGAPDTIYVTGFGGGVWKGPAEP